MRLIGGSKRRVLQFAIYCCTLIYFDGKYVLSGILGKIVIDSVTVLGLSPLGLVHHYC